MGWQQDMPTWLIALENAVVAPFVAAATFIGSMGNIPLATVLNANGVLFTGIMGFIYSDLMVPPLVLINAKYYGKRVALFIAFVMFISIVATALILDYVFSLLDIIPKTSRQVQEVAQFALDYTFYMNLAFVVVAVALIWLHRRHQRETKDSMQMEDESGLKRILALLAIAILVIGLIVHLVAG